jgi:hypothetical protein
MTVTLTMLRSSRSCKATRSIRWDSESPNQRGPTAGTSKATVDLRRPLTAYHLPASARVSCAGLDGAALEMYVGYMIQARATGEIAPLALSDVEVECMGPKRRGAGTVRLLPPSGFAMSHACRAPTHRAPRRHSFAQQRLGCIRTPIMLATVRPGLHPASAAAGGSRCGFGSGQPPKVQPWHPTADAHGRRYR